jgi:catechol 2,3-dioxygenase-like lactoylglutathione lyase family enzyme
MRFGGTILLLAASATATPDRPAITGISDITLKVGDFAKSRRFYQDFLGFAELPPPTGLVTDTLTIKINDDQRIRLRSGLLPDEPRLLEIRYRVHDARAMLGYLAARGIAVPSGISLDEQGNRGFSVTGPEGLSVGFVQSLPTSRTSATRGEFLPDSRIAPRIKHAGFLVTDLSAAMTFYHDILGFREFWRGSSDGKTLSWICLRAPDGEDYVEFSLCDRLPPVERRGVGNHVGFDQPDMAGAVAILARRRPSDPAKPLAFRVGLDHKRNLGLYDPDGTRCEMVESTTVDGSPMPPCSVPIPPWQGVRRTKEHP